MMAHQTNFNLAPILLFMAWYIPGDSYWEFILVERGGLIPPLQTLGNTINHILPTFPLDYSTTIFRA